MFDNIADVKMAPRTFIVMTAAAVIILFCGTCYYQGTVYETILAALSFVLGGFLCISNAYDALFAFKLLDPDFLAAVGAVISFICGSRVKSAIALIIYQVVRYLCTYLHATFGIYYNEALFHRQSKVHWILANQVIETESERITAGMALEIRVGEEIPVESKVTEGTSAVDLSAITGKSEEIEVEEGSIIASGAVNKRQVIRVEALKDYNSDSFACRNSFIHDFDPSTSSSCSACIRYGRIITLVLVIVAGLLAIILPVSWNYSFHQAAAVSARILMIAAPLSALMSAPVLMLVACGQSALEGILIKDGRTMEKMAHCDVLIADRQGTLFVDEMEVESIHTEIDADEFLQIACALEKDQKDEMAQAIINSYTGQLGKYEAKGLTRVDGLGLNATYNRRKYYLGNERYMKQLGFEDYEKASSRAVYLADKEKVLGHICFRNNVNESAYLQIKQLHDAGISKVVIMSGEPQQVLDQANELVRADEVIGGLSTEEKLQRYQEMVTVGHSYCVVGDARKDEQLIKKADVAISWGLDNYGDGLKYCDGVIVSKQLSSLAKMRTRCASAVKLLSYIPVIAIISKLILAVIAVMNLLSVEMIVAIDGLITLVVMAMASRLPKEGKRP